MEKIIIYYRLLLKDACRKKTTWISAAGMIVIVFLILGIQMPSQDNTKVGIVYGTSENAMQIGEFLQSRECVFSFQSYTDADALKADVTAGKLICGFILPDNLDKKMEEADLKETVLYLTTPLEVKGEVAKETFYAAFLAAYGEELLKEQETEIYGNSNAERRERLEKEMERLLLEDEVFQINPEYRKTDGIKADRTQTACRPVQGILGMIILLLMFPAAENDGMRAFERSLCRKERLLFSYVGQLAFALPLAVTALVCVFFSGRSRGMLTELVLMLVLVLYGGVWNLLLAEIGRGSFQIVSGLPARIILMFLLCPVFVDLSQYIPAVKYIRSLFPLGIYL